MNCPYCGSNEVEYHGADDGGGDYVSSVCDEFECFHCGNRFEENCIEVMDYDDDQEPDSSGGWDEPVDEIELKKAWDDFEAADSFPF